MRGLREQTMLPTFRHGGAVLACVLLLESASGADSWLPWLRPQNALLFAGSPPLLGKAVGARGRAQCGALRPCVFVEKQCERAIFCISMIDGSSGSGGGERRERAAAPPPTSGEARGGRIQRPGNNKPPRPWERTVKDYGDMKGEQLRIVEVAAHPPSNTHQPPWRQPKGKS